MLIWNADLTDSLRENADKNRFFIVFFFVRLSAAEVFATIIKLVFLRLRFNNLDSFNFKFCYVIANVTFYKTIIINKHIYFNFIITNRTIVNYIYDFDR
ncbi:hypothetical protein FLP_21180 [Flavobacterium piscis]|uniref:Uncharacterized protein n=1 Tax=Flavobacterium piscis TaxID=1114874 RepID=A0ABX2XBS4_9FLAO|nr:hypothetical protein FLP_21180 [Flavobacterium piscis]